MIFCVIAIFNHSLNAYEDRRFAIKQLNQSNRNNKIEIYIYRGRGIRIQIDTATHKSWGLHCTYNFGFSLIAV